MINNIGSYTAFNTPKAQQRVAFGSKIKFVGFYDYLEKRITTENHIRSQTSEVIKFVQNIKDGINEGVASCVGIILHNKERASSVHLKPTDSEFDATAIEAEIDQLSEGGTKKVQGLVYGAYNESNEYSDPYKNTLEDLKKKKDFEYTLLYGQNTGCASNVHFSVPEDTYHIWASCSDSYPPKVGETFEITSPKRLQEFYSEVNRASDDEIEYFDNGSK